MHHTAPRLVTACCALLGCLTGLTFADGEAFHSAWRADVERPWVGPEYWANRLQDWRISNGRLECVESRAAKPMRTVHLLTHRLSENTGWLEMSVRTGVIGEASNVSPQAASGFLIGAGGRGLDYRAAALIHHTPGEGGGLFAGVDGRGRVFIRDFAKPDAPELSAADRGAPAPSVRDIELHLAVRPSAGGYSVSIAARDSDTQQPLSEAAMEGVDGERLIGNVALVSHPGIGQNAACFWFRDWSASGTKLGAHADDHCGPILSTQYTVHDGVLKLTAQLMPLGATDNQSAELQIGEGGEWKTVAETQLIVPGFTAPFRVESWDAGRDTPYRVVYDLKTADGRRRPYQWAGTIRRDPGSKPTIVVAAFTGNHNALRGVDRGKSFPWRNGLWFPHNDIVDHVTKHDPDLLFFSGDQVYEGASPTSPEKQPLAKAELDYLYKWYLWCWAFRDLARDRPGISIPDDHDVYHGNLWGMGGKPGDAQVGGYSMPPSWVNMVERTQASHLPDPYDPTPVEQGIGVYYTALTVGEIGFAVIEDRKFKSSPTLVKAEKTNDNHIIEEGFDGRKADVPGAELLGERQLRFLRDFCADWRGQQMKAVLSQTIFANLQTREQYPDHLDRDLDSNGWPQSGRARALEEMRKGFALHIAGDQHLGSVIHHGIDEWEDAGWSLCVPSVANFYLRFWEPLEPGGNHQPGMPPYTGRYFDGLGNRLTVHAVANPTRQPEPGQFPEPLELHRKAPGYGIVRFSKPDRTMTLECWPRYADPKTGSPYPGWPITVSQLGNYGRQPVAYLPTIQVTGMADPVVQVIDEADGETVYTLRIKGKAFRPGVFREGQYTVKVGEPAEGEVRTLEHVAAAKGGGQTVRLAF